MRPLTCKIVSVSCGSVVRWSNDIKQGSFQDKMSATRTRPVTRRSRRSCFAAAAISAENLENVLDDDIPHDLDDHLHTDEADDYVLQAGRVGGGGLGAEDVQELLENFLREIFVMFVLPLVLVVFFPRSA